MKPEHLEAAITDTARAYEGAGDIEQLICEALRGVRARASRYEFNDPDPHGYEKLQEIIRAEVREEVERIFTK